MGYVGGGPPIHKDRSGALMEKRVLGSTGLAVSALGFGASALGGVFAPVTVEDALATVRAAWDLGINYMDVSPYYGRTQAESVLGRALVGLPRDQLVLSSKAGRNDVAAFDFRAAAIVASVEASLGRLGTDYLDVVFLHDIEFAESDAAVREGLEALARLQRRGLIRYRGVSGLPLAALQQAVAWGGVDVALSYCHYCLNDTTLADALPDLTRAGAAVINAAPLAMGLLTRRGPPPWHPAPPLLKAAARRAAQEACRLGVPVEQLALQFALSQASIPTTLVSAARPDHVAQNVRWARERCDSAAVARVRAILAPVQNMSWPSGRFAAPRP